MLLQEERPIAYFNKAMGPRHKELLVYEKEVFALATAVTKWRHYLEGAHFIIRT